MASGIVAPRGAPRALLRRALAHAACIRYRLLLVNVLVAAFPLVGIGFARLHEQQLLTGLERDMIHQGQVVRALLDAEPGRPRVTREAVLRAAAGDTRTRIRLLDATGTVIADSHRTGPPEGAEPPVPHLASSEVAPRTPEAPQPLEVRDRREVRAALAGRYGAATRLWRSQDRVFLFAALPLREGGGAVYVTKSTHDVQVQLYRLRTWLIRVLVATLIMTTLISLLLSTTIARPLGKLTRRAQRVAGHQPVDASDGLDQRADEIGQLARALGTMTRELERRAHDARTLAADISHELKTPLAGIRGAAELLRDGAAEDPEVRDRFLAMILEDAARIDRDVSRLLELARAQDDRGTPRPVELVALAQACASRAWSCPVALVPTPPSVSTTALGREAQLAAAIENLVANATQHAAPDSTVTVAIERRETNLRVAVTNVGPALSATAQRNVWDRFYTTRTGAGGTGLGLAIVRSVALAHGGSVGVCCAEDRTTFWFETRALCA